MNGAEANQKPRSSRLGVCVWVLGMATLGIAAPFVASGHILGVFDELEVDLPELARIAVQFGATMRCSLGMAVWAGVVVLTSLPGLFVRHPGLQRLYVFGGVAALIVLASFAWVVHSTMSGLQHALGD